MTKEYLLSYRKNLKIVAIGASTGGPTALEFIFEKLPKNLNLTFIVVQHMPGGYTQKFAERLNKKSNVNIIEAKDNDRLRQNYCFVAPGNKHMEITKGGKIKLIEPSSEDRFVPSINITFNSLAKAYKTKVLGIILTGMCNDGAEGLLEIKNNGGITLVQDKKTSRIFGMPKSAINIGATTQELPLEKIADKIKLFAPKENNLP